MDSVDDYKEPTKREEEVKFKRLRGPGSICENIAEIDIAKAD